MQRATYNVTTAPSRSIWHILSAAAWMVLAVLLIVEMVSGSKVIYNEMRAAPIFGLVHGYDIYQKTINGPSFCVIYAPLSYLAYFPMTLGKSPYSAFFIGTLLAGIYYYSPLVYWMMVLRRRKDYAGPIFYWLSYAFIVFTLVSTALGYSSSLITADAPAIGAAGLAALILLLARNAESRWGSAFVCAALSVFSVGCKQNMLLVLAAFIGYAWLRLGKQYALRFVAALTVCGVLSLVALRLIYGGFEKIVFHNILVPSHIEFFRGQLPHAARMLYQELHDPLLLLGAAAIFVMAARPASLSRLLRARCVLLFVCALVLMPGSLAGKIIKGGSDNALSPTIYFFLLGVVVLLYDTYTAEAGPVTRKGLLALVILFCVVSQVSLLPKILTPFSLHRLVSPNSSKMVFDYSRKHSGEIYFPFNTVSVLLAEGKIYHSDWGVGNLKLGGETVTQEEIYRFIPPSARYVAYAPDAAGDWLLEYLAPDRRRVRLPELPEFHVFEIQR